MCLSYRPNLILLARNYFQKGNRVNIKIYVATHKEFNPPHDDNYMPIYVGKELSETDSPFSGDNTGDNISALNKSFCELTALYWIWKNDFSSDYVGVVHYRRYFSKHHHGINKYITGKDGSYVHLGEGPEIAASNDFGELTDGVDLILPTREHVGNILENYGACHHVEDMYLVREVIKKIHNEYLDAYDFTMKNVTHIYTRNMAITRKEIFSEYCEWLFSILFTLKNMNFYRNYDSYQKRIFGFISERIFNVWLLKNRDRLCIGERHIINL